MKKTKIEITKSLLAKIDWLESHAWEVSLFFLMCGPLAAMMIESAVRGYDLFACGSKIGMRDTPSAMVVLIIAVCVILLLHVILPKILHKNLIREYINLSPDEKDQVYWSDAWQYRK